MRSHPHVTAQALRFCASLVSGLMLAGSVLAANITVGEAVYFDTSPPLSHLPPLNGPAATGADREVPLLRRNSYGRFPDLAEPDGSQQAASPSSPAGPLTPTPGPIVSMPGLSEQDNRNIAGGSVVPPDTNGDIGFDSVGNRIYVQYINSVWGVFDVNGNLINGPFKGNSLWAGFGGYCQDNNDGDPVVLYDDQAGRWFFSQFSVFQGLQCVAVSTTSDPLGPYHRYAFHVTPGGSNDYPKLGVWSDGTGGSTGQSAYTFTMRDFGGAGGPFSLSAGVMDRDAMLNGSAAGFVKFSNPCTGTDCIEGQLPPHLAGPAPPAGTCPTFWAATDAAYDDTPFANDGYRNHTLCVDWSNPANSSFTEGPLVAAGSNIDRFQRSGFDRCIGPVNGGEGLDCLAAFTMYRAQFRWFGSYGSVVFNTTVDASGADRAGIRWAEIRSADGDSAWYLQQDGTFAPNDSFHRWMGSIAQDKDGNIALGYSVTGKTLFPSVRYTSRTAGDAAGTMPGGEVSCHEGTGAQRSSGYRWGDYSSMSVDPGDDCTFWFTQEYYEVTGSFDFNTRICSFRMPSCGGGDNEPPSVPGAVQIGAVSSNSINMSWGASTDNVAVTGYEIFRDNSFLTAVPGTSYSDTALPPNTTFGYQVRAYDAAGNRSALTNPAVEGTTTGGPVDTVVIIKAVLVVAQQKLKAAATSTAAPGAVLTLEGFGEMTYNSSKGRYQILVKPVTSNPGTVTVTSSLGGSSTVALKIR